MNAPSSRPGMSLSAWLLTILLVLALGAGGAVWTLANWDASARLFGVSAPPPPAPVPAPALLRSAQSSTIPPASAATPADAQRTEILEARIARLESATQQAAGSAGRADALLIAFAARRAIDRGVSLGYLEPLLAERFETTHRQAVATIITASRNPVRLDQLTAEFDALLPRLQTGTADEGLWQATQRELSSLVSIRRADRPSPRPFATADRARTRLAAGQVGEALAEAMRLPGIAAAPGWVAHARSYIAVHRALDEIESTALLAR